MQYARLLAILGRPEEARGQARAAVRMDPVNPFTRARYGNVLYLTGEDDEAITVLEAILREYPTAGFVRPPLAGAYEAGGRPGESVRILAEGARQDGDEELGAALEVGPGAEPYRAALRRAADLLAGRSAARAGSPFRIARLYAAAGAPGPALEWLGRAVRAGDERTVELGVLPVFASLHHRDAFRRLARRAGGPLVRRTGAGR